MQALSRSSNVRPSRSVLSASIVALTGALLAAGGCRGDDGTIPPFGNAGTNTHPARGGSSGSGATSSGGSGGGSSGAGNRGGAPSAGTPGVAGTLVSGGSGGTGNTGAQAGSGASGSGSVVGGS